MSRVSPGKGAEARSSRGWWGLGSPDHVLGDKVLADHRTLDWTYRSRLCLVVETSGGLILDGGGASREGKGTI